MPEKSWRGQERMLAGKATKRLQTLLKRGYVTFELKGEGSMCQGTRRDQGVRSEC